MAKPSMYVKNFDFSKKPCNYSHGGPTTTVGQKMTEMASGGYYSKGGMKEPMKASRVEMASGGYYAKGGMKEPTKSIRMEMVKAPGKPSKMPMRRSVPVAPVDPMIELKAMAKGGAAANGHGMVKTTGSLGIKGNKNPGERNGTPTTATKTGNMAYRHGGDVKKYAAGGPMMDEDFKFSAPKRESKVPRNLQQAMAAASHNDSMTRRPTRGGGNVKKYADGGPMMASEGKIPRELQQAMAAASRGDSMMRRPTRGGKPGISPEIQRALVMEAMRAQDGREAPQGGMTGRMPPQMAGRMPPQMAGQMAGRMPPQMGGRQAPPQMGGQRPGLEQMAAQMAMQRAAPGQMPPQMAARAGGKVSKKK